MSDNIDQTVPRGVGGKRSRPADDVNVGRTRLDPRRLSSPKGRDARPPLAGESERGFPMDTQVREPETQTFVETALKLGGKSEEEARTTGTLDRADDQVEALFAARYQTAQQPGPPRRLGPRGPGRPVPAPAAAAVARAASGSMDDSLEAVRRHRDAGTLLRRPTARSPRPSSTTWPKPATGGCWSTREYGGGGAPFAAFARFLTKMATIEPDRRRPGLGPRLHRRGRSAADLRQRRAEGAVSAPAGQRRAALGLRADRARRRLRPDRAADARPCSTATTTSSTARSCSSPTPSPAGRSAWSA